MNSKITFIQNSRINNLDCLSTTLLSSYILSEDEQKYIEILSDDTASVISSQALIASIKAGSSLYTQSELNKLYVRQDSESYKHDDKANFKAFLNTQLVGNNIVEFTELSGV